MLKVENLTFEVNEEGKKRCLVNHISFDVKDGEMLVMDPTAEENPLLPKFLPVLRRQTAEKFIWMMRTLRNMILTIVPMRESAMHSSNRPVSRE